MSYKKVLKTLKTDIKKGSWQKRHKFNPKKESENMPEKLANWIHGSGDAEDRLAFPRIEGNARSRGLHKLSGMTHTRVNPDTGKREFLLHRGIGHTEYKKFINDDENSSNYHTNTRTQKMSWTPDHSTALNFSGDPHGNRVISSYISEDDIHHIPMQTGVKFRGVHEPLNRRLKGEKEIIVNHDQPNKLLDKQAAFKASIPYSKYTQQDMGSEEEYDSFPLNTKINQKANLAASEKDTLFKSEEDLATPASIEKNTFQQVHPHDFHNAVDSFRNTSEMASANIHPYSKDDYEQMKTFLSKDGKSGYAIKNNNELVSVHSSERGRGDDIVRHAIKMGAKKLDAYDIGGKLPSLYSKHGFKEKSRSSFNPEYADPYNKMLHNERPDFVEMELENKSKKDLATPASSVKLNPAHGKMIADAYENMKHQPNHPKVKRAYNALIKETKQQFKDILKSKIKLSVINPDMENPYNNSKELHHDIKNNNHLWYYPTSEGFGQTGEKGDYGDHPMLAMSGIKLGDKELNMVEIFRIVHDINGHHKGGESGFGPKGEHRAYNTHKKMYSPEAQKALASSTLGQNSWVNFGPHGEHNRKNPHKTIYAEQKAGLLPDHIISGNWHSEE